VVTAVVVSIGPVTTVPAGRSPRSLRRVAEPSCTTCRPVPARVAATGHRPPQASEPPPVYLTALATILDAPYAIAHCAVWLAAALSQPSRFDIACAQLTTARTWPESSAARHRTDHG